MIGAMREFFESFQHGGTSPYTYNFTLFYHNILFFLQQAGKGLYSGKCSVYNAKLEKFEFF